MSFQIHQIFQIQVESISDIFKQFKPIFKNYFI